MLGEKRRQPEAQRRWLYLGASGVLQPLSEEFLYRAADDALRNACRRCRWPLPERHDAR